MLDYIKDKKKTDCSNCKFCRLHYFFGLEKADLEGASCEINNETIMKTNTKEQTVYKILYKKCPLLKEGENYEENEY